MYYRGTPKILATDSNLHHKLWNPPAYNHVHPEARRLINISSSKGFKLILPKGIPTFLGSSGKATTIDLTWANHAAGKLQPISTIVLNNHVSDHQPILTRLTLNPNKQAEPKKWTVNLQSLEEESFKTLLKGKLTTDPPSQAIALQGCKHIAATILEAANKQGKWVTQNIYRRKRWWDANMLNPLVKARNAARRDMLKHKTQTTKQHYYQTQENFRMKVEELKASHWKRARNMRFKPSNSPRIGNPTTSTL
ncbi:hypothetical protein O181_065309 [Austropuccinia psidii MF-1]|uniref:Endonuclease/exonuclease/phosphatase domain-containing protein n=1 Tax=Austropuccinia psidii MF-1 TaxID=1389203 RepID=A0A9Q3I4F1_9BASI|nr:hypothetical protein [Austropuccinia psidii MF-1]